MQITPDELLAHALQKEWHYPNPDPLANALERHAFYTGVAETICSWKEIGDDLPAFSKRLASLVDAAKSDIADLAEKRYGASAD